MIACRSCPVRDGGREILTAVNDDRSFFHVAGKNASGNDADIREMPLILEKYAFGAVHEMAKSQVEEEDPSRTLLDGLRAEGWARDAALEQLHAMLLRGAHHEMRRRSHALAGLSQVEIDDLANHAADDAMTAILAKLDAFRGDSRFSTWAYKFVILEAGVKARRRAWRDREVMIDDESWRTVGDSTAGVERSAETSELLRAITTAIESELTEHQREIFSALALNGVPIDVLAERMETSRGALYKTLHDARRKLRAALTDAGYELNLQDGGE